MGEVVVSSEGDMELEARQTEEEKNKKKEDYGSASSSVVRWERFLPRTVLRILLVEADDSTRQIVAALLRKCSYKVVAVPDGLKAWEVLKGRPSNIDLILTEVELSSISGYALLTLIMEHEICKNIPVIMMSSNDSVSTVYNCMLRGAADFLVKPVRKNELRNLWQHVWRRQVQSSGGGLGQPDESVAQQKVEATDENNDASNHSSGYIAFIQRNRECIDKGSDAQSSCTKPDFEAEEAHIDMQEHSQPKWSKPLSVDMNIQAQEQYVNAKSGVAAKDVCTIEKDKDPDTQPEHFDIIGQASKSDHVVVNSSGEAIDLIGGIDNYQNCSYRSSGSNCGTNKIDSSPFLDLFLRRSHPSVSVNQITDERHKLNHSDASAFSRYINKAIQPQHSTSPSTCYQQKNYEFNSGKPSSDQALDYTSDTHGPVARSQRSVIPFINGQPVETEIAFSRSRYGGLPVPIPARSIRVESLCPAYGSMISPIFCTKSPVQSPSSAGHQGPSFQASSLQSSDPETRNSQPHQKLIGKNANIGGKQTECKQTECKQGMGLLEYQGHFSSSTDQSANRSFCNGTISRLNSIGCRSNGTVSPVPVAPTAPDYVNEEGCSFNHDVSTHRSIQREAALTKFRLKRKERCFEKKVRYESRKKLAEQRPRVKGQFVCQMQNELPPMQTGGNHNGSCSNFINWNGTDFISANQ